MYCQVDFYFIPGLWGYVEYPVVGLASGLAPFSAISNSSEPLNLCIEVLSGGGKSPVYGGRNVCSVLKCPSFVAVMFCSLYCWYVEQSTAKALSLLLQLAR